METTTEKLTKNNKEELVRAHDIIQNNIEFIQTSSGHNYWWGVCDKLMDLATQKENIKVCDKCGHELKREEMKELDLYCCDSGEEEMLKVIAHTKGETNLYYKKSDVDKIFSEGKE